MFSCGACRSVTLHRCECSNATAAATDKRSEEPSRPGASVPHRFAENACCIKNCVAANTTINGEAAIRSELEEQTSQAATARAAAAAAEADARAAQEVARQAVLRAEAAEEMTARLRIRLKCVSPFSLLVDASPLPARPRENGNCLRSCEASGREEILHAD